MRPESSTNRRSWPALAILMAALTTWAPRAMSAGDARDEVVADPLAKGAAPTAGPTAGELALAAIARPFLALESFQADFVQSQDWVGMSEPTLSKGTLYLKKPNLFRIEYHEPAGHLQLSDGKSVWTFVPENGEVLKAALPEGQGGDLLRRILLDSQPEPEVAHEPLEGLACRVLTMIPSEELGLARVRLWTKEAANAILQYEIEDGSGNRSRFRLDRTRDNPPLKASLFSFTPPPGIPVVEVGAP